MTETWLKAEEYSSLNEATPSGFSYAQKPRLSGQGGWVGGQKIK